LHASLPKLLFLRRKLKVPITKLSNDLGNIGPRGRRQRLLLAAMTVAVAGALLFWMGQAGANRWWRVATFPLLWLAAVGVLQARARTCIAFAARGTCDSDAGVGELTPEAADLLRQRAKSIVRMGTILAAILTSLAIAAP